MKKLPKYLENMIDFMAAEEERTGGMVREKAGKLFREELIGESLTAKANPTPRENPTIPDFYEIYELAGKEYGESSLGRALGFRYSPSTMKIGENNRVPVNAKSKTRIKTGRVNDKGQPVYEYETIDSTEGKRFMENLRKFAASTADEVLRGMINVRTKRKKVGPGFEHYKKNWANKSGGEYAPGEKKTDKTFGQVTAGELIDDEMEQRKYTEENRYYKLLIETAVLGLLRPLFETNESDLQAMLYEMVGGTPIDEAGTKKARMNFMKNLLDLLKEREGIVKASIKASEYVGREKAGGGKIDPSFLNLLVELHKIKERGQRLKIVKPEDAA